MMMWEDEHIDDDGIRRQALIAYGAVAATIMQFPEGSTTVVDVGMHRLGDRATWNAARTCAEEEVRRMFAN